MKSLFTKKPILISDLIEGNECPQGTFSLNATRWQEKFPGTKEEPNEMDSSGCYCFFFKGGKDELEKYNREHWIKGKQTSLDDRRLLGARAKVVFVEMRPAAWNAKDQSDKPVYHVYHPIKWKFKEVSIGGQKYVPLYVGKSSHLFKRINLHFSWPHDVKMEEKVEVVEIMNGEEVKRTTETLPRVLKHEKNTVAQFRAGFKFLSRSEFEGKEPLSLSNDTALAIVTFPFDAVSERYFSEEGEIGLLRPPFNVDSER